MSLKGKVYKDKDGNPVPWVRTRRGWRPPLKYLVWEWMQSFTIFIKRVFRKPILWLWPDSLFLKYQRREFEKAQERTRRLANEHYMDGQLCDLDKNDGDLWVEAIRQRVARHEAKMKLGDTNGSETQ